jgi:predicted RNA-binding Zn-ribbon protein involved in translation (DUF1610 family)
MSSVMIKCPKTGGSVSTQIEVEPSVFRRLPKIASQMHCPACGQEHVWMTSSAWLSGEPRLVEAVEPVKTQAA